MTGSNRRTFDGLVCLGGADWWYHNRGHYDMQMVRYLRPKLPILYVNSIGTRVPSLSEGRMFIRRVVRKLRSWTKGFHPLDDRFALLSPVSVPGPLGMHLTRPLLVRQVRSAARRLGIERPLLWIECLPGAELVEPLAPTGVVYQRTDRYEEFPGTDRTQMEAYDQKLKRLADVTLYASTELYEGEKQSCRNACYVDHGVDFESFRDAGRDPQDPPDLTPVGRPRIIFVGGLDDHTFDRALFLEVVERCLDLEFVLVGGSSLPEGWCTQPNVHQLGRKPYEEVPQYMAGADVLIMPWNDNEWIRACNPVKLKEYLATGRPVVSTDFPELKKYDGYVRIAKTAERFAEQIRAALAEPDDPEMLRARVETESWSSRAERVLAELEVVGLELAASSSTRGQVS